ncbi:MAG: NAD-dependent epimerase/dehydratase family protein [Verrucomicrobia bacterium]|nr:NAD-dependent epimerase/dehydratase family protein [Verrucomicrobiota bacterium]
MKIGITGACGHIGSRLIRELPKRFPLANFVLIDNLSTQRYASLFNLPGQARIRFVEGDVRTLNLARVLAGVDAVIHLAAIADATASFDHPDRLAQHNLACTQSVADACLQVNAALIFPSSTSVYGPRTDVVDEGCPAADLNPQSPYAETKLNEEKHIASLGGLRYAICRFGTIFGVSPGMRFHTAVNKFCWQAVLGQPLTVWRAALQQQRPYLDLGDAASAVALIIDRQLADQALFNVLTLNATVSQIVELIRHHIPSVNIDLIDRDILNQQSYTVLDDHFRAHGFVPAGSLASGIAETLALLGVSLSKGDSPGR